MAAASSLMSDVESVRLPFAARRGLAPAHYTCKSSERIIQASKPTKSNTPSPRTIRVTKYSAPVLLVSILGAHLAARMPSHTVALASRATCSRIRRNSVCLSLSSPRMASRASFTRNTSAVRPRCIEAAGGRGGLSAVCRRDVKTGSRSQEIGGWTQEIGHDFR